MEQHDVERIARATLKELGAGGAHMVIRPVEGQPGQWRRRDSGAEAFVIQSTDAGKTWKKLQGAVSQANRSFVESFAFDPVNPDRMYAAQQNGDLFGSDDSGESWFKLNLKVPELSDMKAAHA